MSDAADVSASRLPQAFVRIPRGTFRMGAPASQPHFFTEVPHIVTISRDFEMQATAVTQLQWVSLMGYNPSFFHSEDVCPEDFLRLDELEICARHPVESLTWDEAQRFIRKMNERGDDFTYRLPTESEWEYAARAGTETPYWFGSNLRDLPTFAWHLENSGGHSHAVAEKPPNPWGLYDMGGNVWQWVEDFFGPYPTTHVTDPRGPASGQWRSFRGCGWKTARDGECPEPCRTAYRNFEDGGPRDNHIGFRLVRTRR
jgi:formylglycine-generating enzyme required for sulfatase activity